MTASGASLFCVACEHNHPVDCTGAILDRCRAPGCPCELFFRKRGTRTATAATKLALSAERHCVRCNKILRRRETPGSRERVQLFLERRFCNRKCAGVARSDSGAPAAKEQLPRDRCWAGFIAGQRCVLSRGSHVTHRDEAGHEFVRVERRPVERTEHHVQVDSLAEHPSMRSDWRSARGRFSR